MFSNIAWDEFFFGELQPNIRWGSDVGSARILVACIGVPLDDPDKCAWCPKK
jgi:hypothetical protein